MWSDEFDKKINDAADNHLPPFHEEDWNKMNVLLDKHLPEKKKKRPFMPILFLLLAGLSMLVILTTYKQAPVESFSSNSSFPDPDNTQMSSEATSEDPNVNSTVAAPGDHYPIGHPSVTTEQPVLDNNNVARQKRTSTIAENGRSKQYQKPSIPAAVIDTRQSPAENVSTAENENKHTPSNDDRQQANNNPAVTDSVTQTIEEKKEEQQATETVEEKKEKSRSGKGSKWQISFSTGPDLSLVGLNKTGDWKMQYGIGLGYSVSDRIQIRTGFLVSRKLYYADSSDYNPPKGFWDYYPNLQKIDANCLVYEIPLNVVYSFPSAKRHQWFLSGGLSSYLMKEETYEYYYKDPSGQDRYRERTINNENDHIFSIVQLSGGYQYKFNNRLSLMAEPYMKLPLGGVGFGKVKLNNTGILFTVGYKPFARMGK
ncbi:outer membrane beta-barrel protein [Terrimonas sp. NA20]|uniref:Outer membrane beta-barrel protein n=1 Tax=Terrimonas ginsenosidimutans TaxID=2908004 RepID=A0ABS9KQ61_9BACT|nr:outer membrane beta-barrel protein [Terrimonas ginsenosidimutans]MCG2614444.1 outer membrane beta-barrel protein [Terrimonas ginsenosidimutans]